jgi:hypothetical protein
MIRLIGVELTRFRSRRAIILLILAAAVLTFLVAAKTSWDTRPLSADDLSSARAQAASDAQQADLREQIDACIKDPSSVLGPNATVRECEALAPDVRDYYPRQPLDLAFVMTRNGYGVTLLVVGLIVIAGSTFAGADWSSGSIVSQLVFEARRSRLWWAKAAAVTIGSALVGAVLLGGFWLGMYLVATSRGIAVPHSLATGMAGEAARGIALTTAAGLGAYALTMLFRHTVATLALLFAYSVGGEIVVNLLPVAGAARWSLGNNVTGWVRDNFAYFDDSAHCPLSDTCSKMVPLGHVGSGVFLLVLLVVAMLVSWWSFTRRDA